MTGYHRSPSQDIWELADDFGAIAGALGMLQPPGGRLRPWRPEKWGLWSTCIKVGSDVFSPTSWLPKRWVVLCIFLSSMTIYSEIHQIQSILYYKYLGLVITARLVVKVSCSTHEPFLVWPCHAALDTSMSSAYAGRVAKPMPATLCFSRFCYFLVQSVASSGR